MLLATLGSWAKKNIKAFKTGISFFVVLSIVLSSTNYAVAATVTAYPNADGSPTDWTRSGAGYHYQLVDEATCNGNTDYVYSTTVGQQDFIEVDLSALPFGSNNVTEVHLFPCASAYSAGRATSTMAVDWTIDNGYQVYNSAVSANYAFSPTDGTTPVNLATSTWSGLSMGVTPTSTMTIKFKHNSGVRGSKLSQFHISLDY